MPIKKSFFILLGLLSLGYLLYDYGLSRFILDFDRLGFGLLFLILTFIPTLLLYSWSWLLVSDRFSGSLGKRFWIFFRMTVISIAWNNLTPFLKVGGEPVKVLMLDRFLNRTKALQSVVVYNVVHTLGSLGAVIVSALIVPLMFPVKFETFLICYFTAFVTLLLFFVAIALPRKCISFLKKNQKKKQFLRKPLFGLSWFIQRTAQFYRRHGPCFWISVSLEIIARFIEGLTFYYAFQFLGNPISFFTAGILETARIVVDNLFFFIPYQLGSREAGVFFVLKDVFHISTEGYFSAVWSYRFVEMSWIVIGYGLWLFWKGRKRAKF